VEEMGEEMTTLGVSKVIFNLGKPSSITFNVGAPTFWGDRDELRTWKK